MRKDEIEEEEPPRLILFDLMETLVRHHGDDRPYWFRLGELIEFEGLMDAAKFNADYGAWRDMRGDLGHIEVTLNDRLIQIVPDLATRQEVQDRIVGTYMMEYERATAPCDGVAEMLGALEGIAPLGVVSNFFVSGFPRRLLDRHGLALYFDFVIDSAEIGLRKPAPGIYLAALERAGIPKSEANQVIFIGDNWTADIEGPRLIGMNALLYSQTVPAPDNCHVIRGWDEFRPRWHKQSEP